jgi:rhodanese-related sulfurtransferase
MPARIHLADAKRLLHDGAQVVEVLPKHEYDEEHLPGAISIPLKTLDARTTAGLDKRAPVLVYCWDELCDLSPRAAHRLETLGFEQVYDYVEGKADWLGNGLPREGEVADRPYAGELADSDPPTCKLGDSAGVVRARLEGSRYGYCTVVSEDRVVLGRVRKSDLSSASDDALAESLMQAGPSTVRFNQHVDELVERLQKNNLATMIVTTPGGCLLGVFHREDGERYLRDQRRA